jgi:hypothetical protein
MMGASETVAEAAHGCRRERIVIMRVREIVGLTGARIAVVIACVGLAAARVAWPDARLDSITVSLLAIAAVALVLPGIRVVLPFLRQIELGPLKLELRDLDGEVQRAREAVADRQEVVDSSAMSQSEDVLRAVTRDPRAALLLISARLEQQVQKRLEQRGLQDANRPLPLFRKLRAGVDAGIFPEELLPAFRDFWHVRSRVAHGHGFEVPDSTVLSLGSLGLELLQAVSVTTKGDNSGA